MTFSSPKMQNHVQNIRENVRTIPKVRNQLIFFIFISFLYTGMHVYLGIRSFEAFSPIISKVTLGILIGSLGLLFPYTVANLDQGRSTRPVSRLFAYAGYYWAAFFLYAVMLFLSIDLFRLVDRMDDYRLTASIPIWERPLLPAITGTTVVAVTLLLLLVGTWLARHPRIRSYEIQLDRPLRQPMRVALLSDIHFGSLVSTADLRILRDAVNACRPDLILLAGDLIDNSIELIARTDFSDRMRELKATHGVYGILGNHEYINAAAEDVVALYQASGIHVLRDEHIVIDHQLTLIGRDDKDTHFTGSESRIEPMALIAECRSDLPVLLMQHQPSDLTAIADAGADLTVAGHTHRGQLFPLNIIQALNKKNYQVSFGHRLISRLHIVISSGYGTYGPPIRLGSRAEIVLLHLQ